jgi:putative ubiquitin-RnfH superfamily antitoxin RatB of RatAB toxin-antitoxin module
MRQLQADPRIMEHARLAAAQLLLNVSQDTAVKAALLASGIMELRSGQQLPVARYGISGM